MKKSVYEMVTERILEELENGVVPWRRPWVSGGAVNWKTQKPYRGINTFLLPVGEYATFNQITEEGGKVKKGAKSYMVVFWTWLEKDEDEKEEKIPYLRYYRVFNIATQVEGLESKRRDETFDHNPIEEAERIVKGFRDAPNYTSYRGRAVYMPLIDRINCPPLQDFTLREEYYSTLFHEMVHSTGHECRLKREAIVSKHFAFGDESYSKEELVAEMGAAMLCGAAGIDNTIPNSASYIESWLRVLKEDSRLVVQAAGQAQKAADYILGTEVEKVRIAP